MASGLLGNLLGGGNQGSTGANPFGNIFGPRPNGQPQSAPTEPQGPSLADQLAAAEAERKAREAEEAAKTRRMWNTVGVIAIATAGLVALIAAIKALTKRRPMRWTTRRRER